MISDLTIVIPAYNEEDALNVVLPNIIRQCDERNWQIIVVNDGSTDQTKEVLARYSDEPCFTFLSHKVNRGYGAALKTGILAVKTEYLVTMDADGQHRFEDVETLFEVLKEHDADMIIGSRENQRSASRYRALGKVLIRKIAKILVPNSIYDLNSGMKLYCTSLAKKYVVVCPDSMAFSEVIALTFINHRQLVMEHPITVNERAHGRSTITTRTALRTLIEICNLIMLFNPTRLLLPISLVALTIGSLWGIPFILKGRGVSVASLLMLLSGVFIFIFGLVAEQLSLIRNERMAFFRNDNGNESVSKTEL